MEEATLWQAVIKFLITFVAVACIKEIDTFKFSLLFRSPSRDSLVLWAVNILKLRSVNDL